jgi:hypothetical protein
MILAVSVGLGLEKSNIQGQATSSSCLERVYDAVDVLQRTKKKK